MMEYIGEWMEKCQEKEKSSALLLQRLKHEKKIFSVDFIKCCLKLVNISQELETACAERIDFVEKVVDGRKNDYEIYLYQRIFIFVLYIYAPAKKT